YFVISAMSFSSGMTPASESLFAFTIIMNRIVVSPRCFGFPSRSSTRARWNDDRAPARSTRRGSVVDRLVHGRPEVEIHGRHLGKPCALGHQALVHAVEPRPGQASATHRVSSLLAFGCRLRSLAAGHRADDEERLGAGRDRLGKRDVG